MSIEDYLFRGLSVVAVVLLGVIAVDWINRDTRVPIAAWGDVEVLNSPVQPGGYLRLRVTRDKVRNDCPVTAARRAVDQDGKTFSLEGGVSPGGPADAEAVLLEYPIPATMPPGYYDLRVTLTYNCPTFTWVTEQPGARFRVINARP